MRNPRRARSRCCALSVVLLACGACGSSTEEAGAGSPGAGSPGAGDLFGNASGAGGGAAAGPMVIDDGGVALLPDGAVVYLMLWARPCPRDSTLSYASFGESFFTGYCLGCHGAQRKGADRGGAPDGVDFDTLAEIRTRADAIFRLAADANTLMPDSGPRPSADERRMLGDWLACGTP